MPGSMVYSTEIQFGSRKGGLSPVVITPVIPALKRLMQKNFCKTETNQSYILANKTLSQKQQTTVTTKQLRWGERWKGGREG